MIPITAIILTSNEEINISACLQALQDVSDIVVVDSASTDNTAQIARSVRSDVRFFEHEFVDFGDQRNWALAHTNPRFKWVLFVDADEFCTPELLAEISSFIASPGEAVGAYIAGQNYFLGQWLRRCTFYPSYQLRLLQLGSVTYRKEGHGQREVSNGPFYFCRNSWRHEGFSQGVAHWVARHNRYSSDEVELILRLRHENLRLLDLFDRDPVVMRRAAKRLAARMPMRPLTRFLYTYVLRFGFLDGLPGLYYCLLRVAHDIHIVVKLKERLRAQDQSLRAEYSL